MENNSEENEDKVDSEISITEASDDPPGEGAIEEEDDVEELHKSLKQIVQDEDVKPKLQYVMMDPSFSMVTVQSEDSGIVWETASSRCSTPWASEASSTSDTYSLDGSGTQGKIVIIMDEDKIIRKRKKRSGRGKIGDRLRRPSSRNFPGGNERPLMAEVSVPNVRPENNEDGESKMDKEQELFSLVSEGYEILNIVVPSRLPTVDEEDSTDLADNLSYLEENPRIKSTPRYEQTHEQSQLMEDIIEIEQDDQVIVQVEAINLEPPAPASFEDTASKQTLKDGTYDMDYFEKFTLLDEHVPGEHTDVEESMDMRATEQNRTSHHQEKVADGLSTSEDAFVFISDVDIASEHLDEVFYGRGCDDEHDFHKKFENEEEDGVAEGEQLTCPMKKSGSDLFVSEETTLMPIFLPSGPPKIIDPILLEEPPAMSFHYSDLYEDAVGVRKKEDDVSDVESVVSETSVQRKLSVDSDDATGYLEKFILKDETPVIEDESVTDDPPDEGRLIWPQSKFELTGCLTRVVEDDDEEEREKEKHSGSFRGTSSPHEDCVAAITPNDETAELERAVLLEKVDMTGQKSPGVCHETYKSQVEHVERTLEDRNEEMESSLSSDCLVDQEIRFKSKADSEETTSVKETATHTTESPKITCEGIGSCGEEIHLKSDEVQVNQKTDFMDQETAAEIIVETYKQLSEEVAIGSETAEATTEESVASPGSESMHDEISDAVEIKRTKGDSVEQESAFTQEDMVLALAPVESEETSEEVVTDKDIQAKAVKSVDVERTESLHKEMVSDGENCEMKAKQESAYQGAGGIHLVMELENTIKDEPESDCITREIITVSKISRGDTTGIDVASKDVVHLNHEPPDGTYAARTGKGFKEKVLEKRTEGDKAKRDASVSKTIQTSQIEPQFPQKPSADENMSITEKENTIVLEDTHFKLPNDQKNSEEAEGVLDDQNHKGPDMDHLRIPELHGDSQSTPDLGIAEEREGMLLRLSPLVMAEAGRVGEEEEGLRPSLRSFSPQEDLSAFGHDATISTPEPFQVLHHDEDKEAEEMDYEVITLHEARELKELDTEVTQKIEAEELFEDAVDSTHDVNRDKGLEADYEVIEYLNGYPLSESELLKTDLESQRLGTYCMVCQCPVAADDKLSGEHEGHEVITIENAYEEMRDKLSKRISVLQERSENVTDLVSELELAYNSVEEHGKASEQCLEEQNEEIMKMVMDQYNEMSQNMEEEKKVKLEQLYDRIVSFQESIDSAKEALEKSTKEIEETDPLTLVSSSKDINTSLTAALDAALSLELTPSAFPLFEDYAKSPSGNGRKELKGIPVPQRPHLQAQETNSATSTSVTVYWKVNAGDIIDCFQVYCMEEPQGAVSEEYRVTVKESYCTLEDLEADKCYKVWVMAVNYTGCSLPSEKLSYKTAPSVPVIDTEKCTVCWDSAMIRWSPTHPDAVESYTLEYCRQYACEGEGLRSISGIRKCEQKVLLHSNENYLFYIKAANAFGASEQSEAALISTRGTRFHLLPDSAHPSLELSEDRATVRCYEGSFNQQTTSGCREIHGELLPPRGYHYWETTVGTCNAYRIGVAYPTTAQGSPLGEDSTSWCIHCVPTGTSCRFELLHDCTQTAIFTVEVPTRIGILLDFFRGRLSFFNAQNGQLLGLHWHRFTHACHPVLALERPGALGLHMVAEMPEFTKH